MITKKKGKLSLLCSFFYLASTAAATAQVVTDSARISENYKVYKATQLQLYEIEQPNISLLLLPSFGFNTVLLDGEVKFAPNMSFNLLQFLQISKEVRRREAEKQALAISIDKEREQALQELQGLQQQMELQELRLQKQKQLLQQQLLIFNFDSLKYARGDADADIYYNAVKAKLQAEAAVLEAQMQLQIMRIELLKL